MSVQAVHLHFDVYTSAGYMLRIDCWEAEKNLKTTPRSECALTSLAIDANNLVGSLSTQCCFIQSIIFSSRPEIFKALLDCYIFHRGNPKLLKRLSAPGFVVHQSKDQLALTTGISRSFFADSSYMLSFSVLCSCVCSRLISPSVSSWHKQDNTLMHQSPGHIQRRTPYNF